MESEPADTPKGDQGLAPLDLDKTRRQLGLGDQFIIALLGDFNDKYATLEETLRQFLQHGRRKDAQLYMHSLAGFTGTIAADELHHRAKELEAALSSRNSDLNIQPVLDAHKRLTEHIKLLCDSAIENGDMVTTKDFIGDHQ